MGMIPIDWVPMLTWTGRHSLEIGVRIPKNLPKEAGVVVRRRCTLCRLFDLASSLPLKRYDCSNKSLFPSSQASDLVSCLLALERLKERLYC